MSTLATFIQHSFGSRRYSNQRRKRNKRNPALQHNLSAVGAVVVTLYKMGFPEVLLELIKLRLLQPALQLMDLRQI